jgi:hypothetical protein
LKATTISRRKTNLSDAAVSGLFAGLGAGLLMAMYVGLVGLFLGKGAGVYLGYFSPGGNGGPLQGTLAHLAVSGVYGMLFGLGWSFTRGKRSGRVPGWMRGLAFGILLWVLARFAILPGTGSPLRAIPGVHLFIAHLLYGLALGITIGRMFSYRNKLTSRG